MTGIQVNLQRQGSDEKYVFIETVILSRPSSVRMTDTSSNVLILKCVIHISYEMEAHIYLI